MSRTAADPDAIAIVERPAEKASENAAPVARPVARAATVPIWAGALLVVALWLLSRPYRGVRHDAILYLGQALGRLMPDSIGRDLFLVYGSQDRFSIYSNLMAPLVARFGVPAPMIVGLLASEVLFLGACWLLVRPLEDRRLRFAALGALTAMSHTYGGLGAFSFAEPFLTARVFAEPLAIFALVALMQGRWSLAGLLIAAAALFHPLITLPAIVAGWLFLVLEDRRWLWASLLLVVPMAAGGLGVAPFDALWKRYDPTWWEGVRMANQNAFLAKETLLDWTPLGWDLGVVWLARPLVPSVLRRMLDACVACAVLGTVVWGLGADLVHDVFITQLQLWRTYWLVHLFALLLLPAVLWDLWRRGAAGRWSFWAIVLAGLAGMGNFATGWMCLLWAAVAVGALKSAAPVSPTLLKVGGWISLGGALLMTAIIAHNTVLAVEMTPDHFNGVGPLQIAAGLTLVTAAIGWGVLLLLERQGLARLAGVATAFALFAWGAADWDQRSPWQRFVESGLGLPDAQRPFASRLPPQASVYWNQSILDSWLLLQRPAYLAAEQSAGLLFNRATSIEYMRRHQRFALMDAQREICMTVKSLMSKPGEPLDPAECSPEIDAIAQMCREPGGPDFMIFQVDDRLHSVARWSFPAQGSVPRKTFSLYDCAALRSAPAAR